MKITIALILAALTATTTSQASNRCMWLEALKRNNLDDTTVANLMCIAHHATNFDKDARVDDYFGVFRISPHKWCHCSKFKGPNLCRMDCSALHDNNLNDDIQCALQVIKQEGYTAWGSWKDHCAKRDLREYLTCESSC